MSALRAIGRTVAYIVATIGLLAGLQFAIVKLGWKPASDWRSSDFVVSDGIGFLAACITAWIAARIEKRGVREYGLPLVRHATPLYLEGIVWGAAAPAAIMSMVIACGGASIHGVALYGSALARTALLALAAMIVLGFFEEFAFRGYPLHTLARGIGFWPAAIALSLFFGLLHYFTKPMEDWMDATTVSLLALFLCLTIRRTGSLWFAVGFHTAFDLVALYVLGSPNTGNGGQAIPERLLDTRFTGPAWMTGGPRGLEASAFAFVVLALMFALYELRTKMKKGSHRAALSRFDVEVD